MKLEIYALSLLLLSAGCGNLLADVIKLKSGETIEGRVVLTSDTEVVIEVQVTPSIKEERVFQRSDIADLSQKKPDEVAFEAIKDIRSPDTVVSAREYTDLIDGHLKPFVEKFPDSQYADEINKRIEQLEKDRARVEEGELRVEGRWVSREEYIENIAYYDSFFQLRNIQNLSEKGDLPGAINAFFEFEKKYNKTAAYPDALLLTIQNLQRLERAASAYLRKIPLQVEKREKGLALSSEDVRARILNAVEEERKRENAAIKQAKDANLRYYPLYPENERALQELQKSAMDDLKKLGQLNVTQWKRSVDVTRQALRYAEKGEIAAAEATIKEAEVFWPESEFAKTVRAKIEERKSALAKSSQDQAKAAEDAALTEPAASPTPAATP